MVRWILKSDHYERASFVHRDRRKLAFGGTDGTENYVNRIK